MHRHLRLLLYGILTWLIPFGLSLPFYGSDGALRIDIFAFKSIMIISGAAAGTLLIFLYLRSLPKETAWITAGMTIGITWLLINQALDLLMMVGLFGVEPWEWFAGIGSRYLIIPMMALLAGASAELASGRTK
ncbi:hypothetical protein RJ53_04275 [Methanocalculus chunghsingensis]|uniref:Uncharacterized protein n=1 Tax=Methanocalculus chunghsingensis TaxID=156457 RepID=A0A8J7W6U1_9EURY|nr:hypothetical protein [Methanocalculus chunghsingensis]MBR1368766.1 hypothetical protein [Methanocalculus chunghsingensis]